MEESLGSARSEQVVRLEPDLSFQAPLLQIKKQVISLVFIH